MASFNKVILVGNLTHDPELRYTSSGAGVCALRLAVNRRFTTAAGESREEVCYVDVDVWGKQGESCSTYLRKGSPALVEGRLRMDTWQDRETGKNRSRLGVTAERVQFLGSPRGEFASPGNEDGGYEQTAPPPRQRPANYGPSTPPPQQQAPARRPPPRQQMPAFEQPEDDGGTLDDIPF